MHIVERVPSDDGSTVKYLQRLDDGFLVETAYIRARTKHILCVSTQVGCAIGCTFCVSGVRKEGRYRRSLTSGELLEQTRNIVRELDFARYPQPLLFSFMGEGEPFLNFDSCITAFHEIGDATWPVTTRLAVSTSGIRPDLIRQLGRMEFRRPLKLQVSLHGPTDEVRRRLVPVTKPLAEILGAAREYRARCKRPVEWNYVLCSGVNDDLEHARLLAKLLGRGWHVKFNRLNPVTHSPLAPSSTQRIAAFQQILRSHGITCEYYETNEGKVTSGCGQLSYKYAT
jgi:23S rRNA (adenine2503-C2)-methyltransferase